MRVVKRAMLASLLVPALSSCGGAFWNRDYRLRFWETYQLSADANYVQKEYKKSLHDGELAVAEARELGNNDFRLGVSLTTLADANRQLGDHAEAEKYYEQALQVLKNALKVAAGDPTMSSLLRQDLARVYSSLGRMYASEKKFDLAAEYFEHSVKLYDKVCIPVNDKLPDTLAGQSELRVLTDLAKAYCQIEKFDQADAAFKRAMDLSRLSNFPQMETLEIANTYLAMLQSTGKATNATTVKAEVTWLENMTLALQLYSARRWIEAEKYLDVCLIAARQLPSSHEKLIKTLCALSNVYVMTDRADLAEKCCDEALRALTAADSEGGFDLDLAYSTLHKHYLATQRVQRAVPLLLMQISLRKKLFGADSIQCADVLALLANSYIAAGDVARAAASADRARSILVPRYLRSKRIMATAFELGKVYQLLASYSQAEEMYRIMLGTEGRCDAADERVTMTRHCIIVVALHQKKYKEAQEQFDLLYNALLHASDEQKIKALPYLLALTDIYIPLGFKEQATRLVELEQRIGKLPGASQLLLQNIRKRDADLAALKAATP